MKKKITPSKKYMLARKERVAKLFTENVDDYEHVSDLYDLICEKTGFCLATVLKLLRAKDLIPQQHRSHSNSQPSCQQ